MSPHDGDRHANSLRTEFVCLCACGSRGSYVVGVVASRCCPRPGSAPVRLGCPCAPSMRKLATGRETPQTHGHMEAQRRGPFRGALKPTLPSPRASLLWPVAGKP